MSATLKDELASLRIDHSAKAGGGGSRRGLVAAVVILLVVVVGAGWFWTQRTQAATVRTAVVTNAAGAGASPGSVLDASGYVTARRRATVSSKVTGKVVEVLVEEGQTVRRGQVLARLDDAQIRAGLDVARAQLEAARRAAAEDQARLKEAQLTQTRLNQLVKDQVVGRAEVDTANAAVESLTARIELARQQVQVAESQVRAIETDLVDMVIRAPFDGVAISKDAQPGEMVSPVSAGGGFTRTGICTIVDMSSLEIEVDVSESYINRVRPGQPVEAVLDAYPQWRIPAHVITTVPSADRQKATVRVRIGFTRPSTSSGQGPSTSSGQGPSTGSGQGPSTGSGQAGGPSKLDPRILPDMGVKVSFFDEKDAAATQSEAPRVKLMMPKSAVRTADGTTYVFVLNGDRVERRAIKIGNAQGDQIEVLSGLSASDRVVVEGPESLVDGARVKEQQ